MASQYSSFLQSPNTSLLANDASLCYITTTTEIKEPTAILKHLQAQQKQVEKKEQKILNVIDSQDGVCLETETTLLFRSGGGAYLPGVDENLLDERTVTFPLMHVVRFDADKKIKQIRLYWDQGTLLKQVEAIGRTGRNWPIRDGKAQLDAISKSLKAGGQSSVTNGTAAQGVRGPNEVVINQHKKRESVSATRDPHASLALFAPRDPNEEAASHSYQGPKLAPRESAKPPPREYGELFAGDDSAATAGSTARSASPSKAEGVAFKSGAGKHHVGNRLFDENTEPAAARSPERKKTYKEKYDHFTFGDGEDAPSMRRPMSGGSTKNAAHFSFEEFSTPPKPVEKPRPDYERHWGSGVEEDDPPSPPKRPIVHAARPDAEKHFQLVDNSPAPEKAKSLQREKGMGLYQDPLHADERTRVRQPGVNNTRRGDDFGAQYTMTDASPADGKQLNQSKQTRSDMDSNWSFDSPVKEKKIYKTAGDGMGGRADQLSKLKRERQTSESSCDSAVVIGVGGALVGTSPKKGRFQEEAGVAPDAILSEDDKELLANIEKG